MRDEAEGEREGEAEGEREGEAEGERDYEGIHTQGVGAQDVEARVDAGAAPAHERVYVATLVAGPGLAGMPWATSSAQLIGSRRL